ncbi:hypothetical protein [Hydrogenimonas urashimensis]|uniref:hypothetical protein n=1 Tax=Hydrogenimonas urashimensis TaxID=2740515 RepID=UPI001F23B4D2|nr:hypothetical protein [Hydrogenimonas urashimensis]
MKQMKTILPLRLKKVTAEELLAFAEIEKRPPEALVEEALEHYFHEKRKKMLEKSMVDENAQTNLSYEEFWDGVDI